MRRDLDVNKTMRRAGANLEWTQAPSVRHGMHVMVHQICPVRHAAAGGLIPDCPDEHKAVQKVMERVERASQ